MSKSSSGLFYGTAGAKNNIFLLNANFKEQKNSIKLVDPNNVRFSQTSVNGSSDIIKSMKKNGWKGEPIDVVLMNDGKMTTLDNTRVVAARIAHIKVKANIHGYNDAIMSPLIARRFTTPKGGEPHTWGQAVENRIGKQKSSFKCNNPYGSYTMQKIK